MTLTATFYHRRQAWVLFVLVRFGSLGRISAYDRGDLGRNTRIFLAIKHLRAELGHDDQTSVSLTGKSNETMMFWAGTVVGPFSSSFLRWVDG